MSALEPIVVRRWGDAAPRVFVLHGGPGAPGSAQGLARALSTRFPVAEPLQRTSGRVPLTVAQHVEDLREVCPARVALVGWSWGAMLALSFAARHPERVSALVLVGCGTYDEAARASYQRAMAQRLGEAGLAALATLSARLEHERDEATRAALFAQLGKLAGAAQGCECVDEAHEAALPADPRGHDETWADVKRLQRGGVEPAAFAAIADGARRSGSTPRRSDARGVGAGVAAARVRRARALRA